MSLGRVVDHVIAINNGGDPFPPLDGLMSHGGHPVLTMNAANAVVVRDATNARKLDKSKSTGKIDGLVASAMALATAERHEVPALPSCLTDGPLVMAL